MRSGRSLFIAMAAVLWSTDALLRLPLTRDLSAISIVFMEHVLALGFGVYLIWYYRAYLTQLTARHWWSVIFGLAGLVTTTIKLFAIPRASIIETRVSAAAAIALAVWT